MKTFHVRDGLGIRLAVNFGLTVAIVSGRTSEAVLRRARDLRVTEVIQRARNKAAALSQLSERLAIPLEETAFLADDLNDLPALELAGVPMAVADAAPEVKAAAVFITRARGGQGAVREAVEAILKAQDRWEEAVASYLELLKRETVGPPD